MRSDGRRRQPDASERLRRLLALPDDESAREALLAATEDVSLDVARQALRRLIPLAGPAEIARLRELMLTLDVGIVADVAAALRELGDNHATEIAVAGLSAASPGDRQKAALALRELCDPAAHGALIRALHDPASSVRRVTLAALGRLPSNVETVRACSMLLADDDPAVRAAAVRAVAHFDALTAAASLRAAVTDSHMTVRRAAAEAAPVLELDSLQALLGDDNAAVRVAALEALSRQPRPELIPTVRQALRDPIWHVRRAAADALAGSGDPRVASSLIQALLDPQPLVRARSRIALERLLGSNLESTLEDALCSVGAPLRRALVEILAGRGYIHPLLGLVSDEDANVRIALVHALDGVSTPQAQAALERLAGDADVGVRHAASTVLTSTSTRTLFGLQRRFSASS